MKHGTFVVAALLILAAGASLAQDDGTFQGGVVSAGGHHIDSEDQAGRVGEYIADDDLDGLRPDLRLELQGGTPRTLYGILALFNDRSTNRFGFDLNTGEPLAVSFDYRSFAHNLDHDYLGNVGAREVIWNGTAYAPGGKMAMHEDLDPLGRYSLRYQRFAGGLETKPPFLYGGTLYANVTDQRRTGWKQVNTIDHCAYCHVSGNRREVNEQTKTWRAGAQGNVGRVSWNYEYGATDFRDRSGEASRRWDAAMHPTWGNVGTNGANLTFPYDVEFGSRLLFDDVVLPYARPADNEKREHQARLKADLGGGHAVRATWSRTVRRNNWTNVDGKLHAWAGSWSARLDRRTRATARFLAYKVKVDDVYVDLPAWRSGRPGGGQDFDWTRISSSNRDVLQLDAGLSRKWGRRGLLTAGWRHQVIDRDAMTQSQSSYQGDGTTAADLYYPSTAQANKSTLDRFSLAFARRLGLKGNGRIEYAFTRVDRPYMNVTAMCEAALRGDPHALDDNSLVYYFQRDRYGNGTNQPSQTHRVAARGSYQITSRASVNGSLNATFDKNDELNIYKYWRTVLAPTANLWLAPTDRLALALGYTWNRVESNAVLCPPIFDG